MCLQDDSSSGVLAVGQPVLQRRCQLHQPQWRCPHDCEVGRTSHLTSTLDLSCPPSKLVSVRRLWELLSSPLLSQRYYVPLFSMFSLMSPYTTLGSVLPANVRPFTHTCSTLHQCCRNACIQEGCLQDMHIHRLSMIFKDKCWCPPLPCCYL